MAAGEEAVDEEEARAERFVRAAWQPAARRRQRFLQELIGGDEGDKGDEGEESSLSETRSDGSDDILKCQNTWSLCTRQCGVLSRNKMSLVLHEGKAMAKMADQEQRKSARRTIKVCNIIVQFNL